MLLCPFSTLCNSNKLASSEQGKSNALEEKQEPLKAKDKQKRGRERYTQKQNSKKCKTNIASTHQKATCPLPGDINILQHSTMNYVPCALFKTGKYSFTHLLSFCRPSENLKLMCKKKYGLVSWKSEMCGTSVPHQCQIRGLLE